MTSCKLTKFWDDFSPGLEKAPVKLWTLLGEATAKCRYISGVPLQPAVAEELLTIYLVKGVHGTVLLEGNALTEEQIREQLRNSSSLPPSQEYLGKEVENIVGACNEIKNEITSIGSDFGVDIETIKGYNKRIFEGLPLKKGVIPGKIRTDKQAAFVGGHLAPRGSDCENLLDKLCQRYQTFEEVIPNGLDKIAVAILRAVITHLFLVWIHPFADGNGRTARLLEIRTLLGAGVPMPATHLLSNHYGLTRLEYDRQLDNASKTGKTIDFVMYAVQGFVDQLDEQMKLIGKQQLRVAWATFIHDYFSGRDSASEIRQKLLLLDLSKCSDPVPLKKITDISPRVAKAYADKTAKTLARDLKALRDMYFVRLQDGGYVANKEMIFFFRPLTKDAPPSLGVVRDFHDLSQSMASSQFSILRM
jgi:Fic family protein